MGLTRLHFLLILVLLGGLGYGGYWGYQKMSAQEPSQPPPKPEPVEPLLAKPAPAAPVSAAPIKPPAPTATPRTAAAPHPFSAARAASATYEVVRGDTLWRIAQDHSPVHDGAGWVAIWKANQNQIKNFDRLEVGWTLLIPPKPRDYARPYWTPRESATAAAPSESELVDVRELPIAPESLWVDVAELPSPDRAASSSDQEVDLAQLPIAQEDAAFVVSALKPPVPSYLGQPNYH